MFTKNQKGKLLKKDLPLLKNDSTITKAASQNEIHSETVEKAQFWYFPESHM